MQPNLAETIALAERVLVTQRHDRFAAAALAEAHLAVVANALPLLADPADQLAWRLAQTTLREAQRTARLRPEMAAALDAYGAELATYRQLLDALDGNPEAHVRTAKEALALARSPWAAVAACVWWSRSATRQRQAQVGLREAWARADAYACYMASEAGLWLRMVWERHPLLLEEAPRPLKPKSQTIRIQTSRAPERVASG